MLLLKGRHEYVIDIRKKNTNECQIFPYISCTTLGNGKLYEKQSNATQYQKLLCFTTKWYIFLFIRPIINVKMYSITASM